MPYTLVRYRTRPEASDKNRALIEAVMADLGERRPEGFSYAAFEAEDGSFIHLVHTEEGAADGLAGSPVFQAFVSGLRERQSEPTDRQSARLVGSYRFLADGR